MKRANTTLLSPAELERMRSTTPRPARADVTDDELAAVLERTFLSRFGRVTAGAYEAITKLRRGGR